MKQKAQHNKRLFKYITLISIFLLHSSCAVQDSTSLTENQSTNPQNTNQNQDHDKTDNGSFTEDIIVQPHTSNNPTTTENINIDLNSFSTFKQNGFLTSIVKEEKSNCTVNMLEISLLATEGTASYESSFRLSIPYNLNIGDSYDGLFENIECGNVIYSSTAGVDAVTLIDTDEPTNNPKIRYTLEKPSNSTAKITMIESDTLGSTVLMKLEIFIQMHKHVQMAATSASGAKITRSSVDKSKSITMHGNFYIVVPRTCRYTEHLCPDDVGFFEINSDSILIDETELSCHSEESLYEEGIRRCNP
ncbi:MAG: hypothetical protein AAFY41_01690 [Bacteroidota bacterium]